MPHEAAGAGPKPQEAVRERTEDQAGVTVHMTRDVAGVITSVDEAVFDLLGWRPEHLVGHPSTQFIHPRISRAQSPLGWT